MPTSVYCWNIRMQSFFFEKFFFYSVSWIEDFILYDTSLWMRAFPNNRLTSIGGKWGEFEYRWPFVPFGWETKNCSASLSARILRWAMVERLGEALPVSWHDRIESNFVDMGSLATSSYNRSAILGGLLFSRSSLIACTRRIAATLSLQM